MMRRSASFALAALAVVTGAPAQAPAPAAITTLLAELDAAFGRGDVDAYLAHFQPDHPGAHTLLQQRLQRALRGGVALTCRSTVVGSPRCFGERTVVRVRSEVRTTGGESAVVVVEDSLIALRNGATAAIPTFAVALPAGAEVPLDGRFRCPACNYEVGGPVGWLCVPQAPDRAHALEATTFYLTGTDVSIDVAVRIADDAASPPAATTVAERLAGALRDLAPGARVDLALDWRPASQEATAGFAGAKVAVDLPPDPAAPEGSRAWFHVATLGAVQYVLLVRGSAPSLQHHSAPVRALLDSFRVLDPAAEPLEAAARPLRVHQGGQLRDGTYTNERFGLSFAGPGGWPAAQRCGGAAFRVVWTGPRGGRLWLSGYAVPEGVPRWCTETAERWFSAMCRERGLEIVGPEGAKEPVWNGDDACGALVRDVGCRPLRPTPEERLAPPRRLRLVVRSDLFVVIDAAPAHEDEVEPLRGAVQALRLR